MRKVLVDPCGGEGRGTAINNPQFCVAYHSGSEAHPRNYPRCRRASHWLALRRRNSLPPVGSTPLPGVSFHGAAISASIKWAQPGGLRPVRPKQRGLGGTGLAGSQDDIGSGGSTQVTTARLC